MSIVQSLREAIDRWLCEKENRSLSMLARLSKVSYSTVRRVMQGETGEPSTNTVMNLAAVVMTRPELLAFATEYMPNMVQARTDVTYKADGDELLEVLEDKGYIPILLLSSHRDGTNEEEVRYFFGNEMTLRFNELVNRGLLSRAEGGNWRLEKDLGSVNLETAREWLAAMALICPSENDSRKQASIAHVGWESVNFATALAIYHAGMDFVRTSINLVKDKNNKGDVLVLFGTLFNVLKGSEAYG